MDQPHAAHAAFPERMLGAPQRPIARHVVAGKIPFNYVEPGWSDLEAMLGTEAFFTNRQLWGDLPETYPEFVETLRREIKELELKCPA